MSCKNALIPGLCPLSGAVRVGYLDKEFVINPLRHELEKSDINLIVTSSLQGIGK